MSRVLVTVQDLYHFYGSRLVFKHVAFSLEQGMAVLVTGENGAGKSTLLKCVAGLVRPSGGQVARHVGDHEIAYMGHATFVYPSMTAVQNLDFWNRMYGLGRCEKDLLALLERVSLKVHAFERARGFSRGMAQRLALARILLLAPRVILLDEPSTGLDTGSCELLFHEIETARHNGAGIMWVSHDISRDLAQTDHVLRLAGRAMDFWGTTRAFTEGGHDVH
ncbi:ABC transporter ATP-binding protein [Desulfoplanes formicivorans]|uniref:ABC transporter ATP-binding protein n=1 Tax=Desulfoplanes formicivorans TaxID=1592317 RepID=A0A194AC07_9BACT|nr:ATP-binding cassette domain-containing protein [Desulfoplanes formicivorans]GAU07682.1 ABC transporter ATP-binding protein [Desulfoplanes formicivorans]